jgi:hypothetical protein
MDIAEHLEVGESYCRFRLAETVSMVESVELITLAIAFCRDQGILKLLVDSSGLTRHSPPSLMDRFLMVEDWARAAEGKVIVAMISRPEMIHPQKFGVKVAADLGLKGDVFTNEREALDWLLAQTDTLVRPASD